MSSWWAYLLLAMNLRCFISTDVAAQSIECDPGGKRELVEFKFQHADCCMKSGVTLMG